MDRDIGTEDAKIQTLVKRLQEDRFLIPTFQREFIWEPKNILKLWDSIFRFYPIGSILYWETNSYLHTHRKLGGFKFPHDEDTVRKFKEWAYILDGQQRATALLISILGGEGKVKGDEGFDYTLYFDATDATFFFRDELDRRKSRVNPAFLIRLKDVPKGEFLDFYEDVSKEPDIDEEIKSNIRQLFRIFTDYKVSLIRIKGVGVSEVCEIFERINQEGKKLDPVDIIVARTYRSENLDTGRKGFYLRDNLGNLKDILASQGNRFQQLQDLTIVQMAAMCLRKQETGRRKSFGITPAALDNLTTSALENNWDSCKRTILETIKMLSDLKIHGPGMLPFRYLTLPICYYLHQNKLPKRSLVRQWFWRTAFGREDFRRSTDVYEYCIRFFDRLENGGQPTIEPLVVSRSRLIQASYNYRNALSRAVLAFLANQVPLDFSDPRAEVLDNTYLRLSQAPNLHHIYPRNFLKTVDGLPPDAPIDSLMNICFLRAVTNIRIGDTNPLHYFRKYETVHDFDRILESHLIPKEFIEREEFTPDDYKAFLNTRAALFCQRLKAELPDVRMETTE